MNNYRSLNEVKACFDEVYQSPTPHAYFNEMHRLEYAIGQEARPYFHALVSLMRRRLGPAAPIRMLDLGCSYGVGSALVKYGFSFGEIANFFAHQSDRDYRHCVQDTRDWLAESEPAKRLICVGADASAEAIRFAKDAGLIDGGIAHNLEADQDLSPEERALIRQCNLLISTGAIGYVGEKTLTAILSHLGRERSGGGPFTAVTVLRMFPVAAIAETFRRFGQEFAIVPGVLLRQRRFRDEAEQHETLRILHERDLDTHGFEAEGYLYADLYVAAPPAELEGVLAEMEETRVRLEPGVATGA
jgi:hypothetical protein